MIKDLLVTITDILNQLVGYQEHFLTDVTQEGVASILDHDFERASALIKDASVQKRKLGLLAELRNQWKHLAELQEFLIDCDEELVAPETKESEPLLMDQLRIATETILNGMALMGARQLSAVNLEKAEEICCHSVDLLKFRKGMESVFAELEDWSVKEIDASPPAEQSNRDSLHNRTQLQFQAK